MQNRLRNNEFRTTVVCVDSYEEGVLNGRYYNPLLDDGQVFHSLSQFLVQMEDTLDSMNLPQSFTAARTFSPTLAPKPSTPMQPEPQEGKLATFAVRVLFRQNTSWQGAVTWLEEGREQSFRSVLELILLMDSALKEH